MESLDRLVTSFGALLGSFYGTAAEVTENETVEWLDAQIETAMDVKAVPVSWAFNGKPKDKQQADPSIGYVPDKTGQRPWPHDRYVWFGKGAA